MRLALLFVATAVSAAGCSAAFGLHDVGGTGDDTPPADANPALDHCSASTNDPLRYAVVTAPDAGTFTWSAARTACQLRGMDLAVINDVHELAFSPSEVMPYWVGAIFDGTAWSSVDGCAPFTSPEAPAPASASCGIVADPDGVTSTDCNGSAGVTTALCETPRTTVPACTTAAAFDPAAQRYVLEKTPETRDAAAATCATEGGSLVVIDSFAELEYLSQMVAAAQWPAFWFGATFDSHAWRADTGCTPLFSWAEGMPSVVAGANAGAPGTCVASASRADPEGGIPFFAGMETVACDAAQTYAVCEIPVTLPR